MIIEIPKQRNVTILPQFAIVDKSSDHAARINVSRNACLNSRSEEENIFFDVHAGEKQICGLYSCLQWVRFITLFPNNVFLLLLHVERVCKSFWKEADAYKWLICIMQRVHFQVGVGVFNCQQIQNKDFFRYL